MLLVWQIAQRDYKFGRGKHKSLTKTTYDAVGDHFRELWGKEAGWAHSVLFTADLRAFSERLVAKIEVDEIKTEAIGSDGEAKSKTTITEASVLEKVIKREAADGPGVSEIQNNARTQRVKRRKI